MLRLTTVLGERDSQQKLAQMQNQIKTCSNAKSDAGNIKLVEYTLSSADCQARKKLAVFLALYLPKIIFVSATLKF